MEGVDTARTGWVKDEKMFTLANVGNTKLLWRLKLDSQPRAMHNLFPPLIAERVETAQGRWRVGVVAGVTDDVFGIDVATGQQLGAGGGTAGQIRRPSTTRCVRRTDGRANDGAGVPGQVHGLRGVAGTAGCGRSTPRTATTSHRRKNSFPAAASPTR